MDTVLCTTRRAGYRITGTVRILVVNCEVVHTAEHGRTTTAENRHLFSRGPWQVVVIDKTEPMPETIRKTYGC